VLVLARLEDPATPLSVDAEASGARRFALLAAFALCFWNDSYAESLVVLLKKSLNSSFVQPMPWTSPPVPSPMKELKPLTRVRKDAFSSMRSVVVH
jgi:hypothetical protein